MYSNLINLFQIMGLVLSFLTHVLTNSPFHGGQNLSKSEIQ